MLATEKTRTQAKSQDGIFKALADPTRRQLLDELMAGPRTTGALVANHPEMTRFGVMAHLKILEDAGLVIAVREGRVRHNHLNPVPIRELYERWMRPFDEVPAMELTALRRAAESKT
jgi:DNA-binding transcriptional ArsR family regulator